MKARSALALLLCAAGGAAASEERTVTWYQVDLPPAYLAPSAPELPHDLQTAVDLTVREALQAQGYKVHWRTVNMEQLKRELRENPHVCNGAPLRTAAATAAPSTRCWPLARVPRT